ncbi:hypothetical protein [Sorangium sp. So ce117]|uniref:hypothetical protein n=1 Tax=Sorangium sp. So ce117 TaxID=3133277 RepID=UPI003F5FE78B
MPQDVARKGYIDIIESQLAAQLGSVGVAYTEKVTLFIAHKDRDGADLSNVVFWIQEAERALSYVGGGATSLQARGAWLGERDTPLYENTTLVYSYAPPAAILENVPRLRDFLHRYGREANQGEVALLLENTDGQWFYRIRAPYDVVAVEM